LRDPTGYLAADAFVNGPFLGRAAEPRYLQEALHSLVLRLPILVGPATKYLSIVTLRSE
jgi:hypothetical protein